MQELQRLASTTAVQEPGGRQSFEAADLQGFTAKETCERLRWSNTTLHKRIKEGQIRVVHVGSRIVVPASEIARILRDGIPGRGKKEVANG